MILISYLFFLFATNFLVLPFLFCLYHIYFPETSLKFISTIFSISVFVFSIFLTVSFFLNMFSL